MENKAFNQIKNKKDFKNWIIKNYFSDSTKEWYDASVDESNILEFISTAKNFPQTPNSLVNLWRLKESFKKFANGREKAEDDKEAKYCVGDETLKNIGKEIGDVTPTMVTKLHASAVNKIKFATHNKSLEQMDEDELDDLNLKIFNARHEAAKDYVDILTTNKGKISDIVSKLIDNKFITKNEAELIEEDELVEILKLSNKSPKEISLTLYTDIEKDNNIFKTYQSVVSKKYYKNRKFI
jgi:hypothetical protein